MFLVLLFSSCVVLFFLYLNHLLNYWKRRKVPFVGSDVWTEIKSEFFNSTPFIDQYKIIYDALDGNKYGGCFKQFKPVLVLRDPHIIQKILNTDFEYFRDRGSANFDENEPITNHLFSAPANLWRDLRIRLTPTFTSGKIKYMFDLIKECAEEYQQVLMKSATTGQPFDAKDQSIGYTIEVISSTAFGVKAYSLSSDDSEFKRVSRRIFQSGLRTKLWITVHDWFPFLKPYLPFRLIDEDVSEFFYKTVRETVAYRKQMHFSRNDFLQILISLNETNSRSMNDICSDRKIGFTNELMTAQCFLFFIAGSDTSSLVLSTTLLELALNHDIQDKLHQEIDHYMKENDNKVTYEMIQTMSYLHKVVQESMRKYPVLPFISRVCTKTYKMAEDNFTIEKGTEIIISLAGLHHNPNYFPNAEKFDPERFTNERIKARHNFVYLPFGAGPRNCIGSRFGLVSVKLGIVHLLHKFAFNITPQTIYPLKFKPYRIVNDCAHPLWLKCSLRKSS